MSKVKLLALAVSTIVLAVTGCGIATTNSAVTDQWMSVDQATQTVTLKLDAGFNSVNDYDNWNGYANGNMAITIPVGYTVKMVVTNDGGIPADIGVYTSDNKLAFKGAGDSINDILENPTPGIYPGDTQTYTFIASAVGDYRVSNLINRFPQFGNTQQDIGMWDVLKIVQSGTPNIQTTS